MKINATLAFMFLFVVVMIGSGVVSGLKGYTLGLTALKEVSPPEFKPTQRSIIAENNRSTQDKRMIVPEGEVLIKVYNLMNRSTEEAVPLNEDNATVNQ